MSIDANDLAKTKYWDENWENVKLPLLLHPIKNPVEGRLIQFFQKWIPRGGRLLEIGCGASAWMPIFAKRKGCELWGVDYSEHGLELTRKNLEVQGLQAQLVLGDFCKLDLPKESFRVIYSGGVIEHYRDPTPIFRKSAELLEPGGLKITIIPNLAGLPGEIQKRIDRAVYDVHMPFRPRDLDRFQRSVGLEPVIPGRPFGVFYLGVVNWRNTFERLPAFWRRCLARGIQAADMGIGWLTRGADKALDCEALSPYFLSIYRKPLS